MKTFKLSKKLLAATAIALSTLFVASFASASDVSYASAGSGGATAYSASSGNSYGNGYGGYGIYSYPKTYSYPTVYTYDDGCGCDSNGLSILQSIPVIGAFANPCSGGSLGSYGSHGHKHGINYMSSGFGGFRYLSL